MEQQTAKEGERPRALATEEEVSEMLGVSSRTLFDLRQRRVIPYIRLTARLIRYDRGAVLAALDRHTVSARAQ